MLTTSLLLVLLIVVAFVAIFHGGIGWSCF